jgi:hypothetical protein
VRSLLAPFPFNFLPPFDQPLMHDAYLLTVAHLNEARLAEYFQFSQGLVFTVDAFHCLAIPIGASLLAIAGLNFDG